MKKIVALLLAVIMMLGCLSFAEEAQVEATVYQDELIARIKEIDETFDRKDLTINSMEYLANNITGLFTVYEMLSEEQAAEVAAANSAIVAEIMTLQAGDGEKLAELIHSKIDAMETIGVVAKANLKNSLMQRMLDLYTLNNSERILVYTVMQDLIAEIAAATPEERAEIAEAVFDSFEMIPFGPHNVRDELITLYNQVMGLIQQLQGHSADYGLDGHHLANAYIYIYSTINNPLTDEEYAMAEEVLGKLTADITALGLTDAELTEEQTAAVKAITAEACANFTSLDEEGLAAFEDFILRAVIESINADDSHIFVLRMMGGSFRYLLEVADEETLATVDQLIANLKAAFANNDNAALASDLRTLYTLASENRQAHLLETIATLSDGEAILTAVKLIFECWLWQNQPEMLTSSMKDVLAENNINISEMSEEDTQALYEILVGVLGEAAEDPDVAAIPIEEAVKAIEMFSALSEDQLNNIDHLINSTLLCLEIVPAAQRLSIDATIEKIVSEIDMSEDRHTIEFSDIVALNYGDAAEERIAQLDSLGEAEIIWLLDAISSTNSAYKRLPAEYRGMIGEVREAVAEIAGGLELKGIETDPAVYAQLEASIAEHFSTYPKLTPFIQACLTVQIASRVLNFSGFEDADRELLNSVLDNFYKVLEEGNEDSLELVDTALHLVSHMVYDRDTAE